MNIWTQRILRVICGSFIGTALGIVSGFGIGYTPAINYSYDKEVGSQDSQAMVLGLIIMGLMIAGGCVGFVIGALTSLILDIRIVRRRSLSPVDTAERSFL